MMIPDHNSDDQRSEPSGGCQNSRLLVINKFFQWSLVVINEMNDDDSRYMMIDEGHWWPKNWIMENNFAILMALSFGHPLMHYQSWDHRAAGQLGVDSSYTPAYSPG